MHIIDNPESRKIPKFQTKRNLQVPHSSMNMFLVAYDSDLSIGKKQMLFPS